MELSYADTEMPAHTIAPDAFLEMFPDIAVELDLGRFRAEAWPVRRHLVTEPAALDRTFTAFRSSLGRLNPHFAHWLVARQVRLGELVRRSKSLPAANRCRIAALEEVFAQAKGQLTLRLPAYELPDGALFALDGNHRLCALRQAGRPFEVEFLAIAGPIDAAVLPDIAKCSGVVPRRLSSYLR